jgi:hypothetical protein
MQQEQSRLLAYYQAELASLERKSGIRDSNDQLESIKTAMDLLRYAESDRYHHVGPPDGYSRQQPQEADLGYATQPPVVDAPSKWLKRLTKGFRLNPTFLCSLRSHRSIPI